MQPFDQISSPYKLILLSLISHLYLKILLFHEPSFSLSKKKQNNTISSPKTTTTEEMNKMNYNSTKNRRQGKTGMAKRGLRSLAIAIAIPLFLTLANIYLFGWTRHSYRTLSSKPFWFPHPWASHFMDLACSFLMGLSAWLIWAEGGFHRNPKAAAVYMGQLALGLVWDPMGGSRIGLHLCLALVGTQAACFRIFRGVNPIAGDLIKPCIAWAGFLALVNLKLVYL